MGRDIWRPRFDALLVAVSDAWVLLVERRTSGIAAQIYRSGADRRATWRRGIAPALRRDSLREDARGVRPGRRGMRPLRRRRAQPVRQRYPGKRDVPNGGPVLIDGRRAW